MNVVPQTDSKNLVPVGELAMYINKQGELVVDWVPVEVSNTLRGQQRTKR